MAGMFDWMKGDGGKGKARRRTSGGKRSDAGKRRGKQRRDPANSTEFISTNQSAAGAEPVLPNTPTPAPPSAPVQHRPSAPPPPSAAGAGATQYHAVGTPSKHGLVGVLIVTDGKARDEVFKVFDGENTLGRGESAQVRMDNRDDAISREHAMIIHESGNFGIKPLKEGTNPTFLNEMEVSGGAVLADGDLIRIGNTTFKFRVS